MSEMLIRAAIAAMDKAYSPYSGFSVGAAILDEHGAVHTGANIENAAYPQGCCAEASAISALIMSGGQRIQKIAVAGRGEILCTPCGGCRQKIREFGTAETQILVCDETGLRQSFTLDELLPHSFGPDNLKR
ncbi:cytidine deaminase, homotetrameric [SAR116 cluster alpha proteobacterium HIMB100]|nr:cytidine deaminase, homotetrameric [SAR116 cluster alpha proteobacterium HIMB100]